ncbi:hypothetical protein EJB05_14476 [Eragrostis curvula]|uniref:Uncharacterized protein n=1 Tax=Eragrostis curvula TaxID=38414 RepID=A0A5J9VXM8_9POAL|nr:hypothetical protein EJB05_14475 [Eragrostis curvula]TVU40989.1 hypothetical protein EJB05_14476 [Eragrostis curvula]
MDLIYEDLVECIFRGLQDLLALDASDEHYVGLEDQISESSLNMDASELYPDVQYEECHYQNLILQATAGVFHYWLVMDL